jgi:signal transduction histidine kinase
MCKNRVMGDEPRRDPRRDSSVVYALSLLIYLSTLLRMLLRSPSEGLIGTTAWALMAVFLFLGLLQVPLSRKVPWWIHAHLVAQLGVVMALFLTEPTVDFYALLIVQLSIVATRELQGRWEIAWLATLCVMVVFGLILAFGAVGEILSYTPAYVAACLLLGLYGRAVKRLEMGRARSDQLRSELEAANRRLRALAQTAEENAAAQERARLSRELHDAATQTVFSMNLTAEAARMALQTDPARVDGLLARLQELAAGALAELRSLVHELHPADVAAEGLVRGLARHAEARGRRDGMVVGLTVRGDEAGGTAAKRVLFRAAVEALNNVRKHAGVVDAGIELSFTATEASIRVSDAGRGFDPGTAPGPESFGLSSLREEVEALGGTLRIRSAPGAGTEVEARVPLSTTEESR